MLRSVANLVAFVGCRWWVSLGIRRDVKSLLSETLLASLTCTHFSGHRVHTSAIKPGMHNIVAKEGPSTATRNVQMVKIGRAVPEICLQTDRQTDTDRHADHNTLFLYRGRSN